MAFIGYHSVGCYKDNSSRAIRTLEGTDPILDGPFYSRANPVAKCAVAAMRAGHSMFAVQKGGWCSASATAPQTFDKYGKSTACNAYGEGGWWANQVYILGKEVAVRLLATGSRKSRVSFVCFFVAHIIILPYTRLLFIRSPNAFHDTIS